MRVVAIYARVSTGEQNPELQLRELRDYAARRGFTVHREYVDQSAATCAADAERPSSMPSWPTRTGAASNACWSGSTTASPVPSAR